MAPYKLAIEVDARAAPVSVRRFTGTYYYSMYGRIHQVPTKFSS
eukprot:SAG31_NODE_3851_length_3817_cov_89.532544_2_plen_44_part_00